MARRRSDTCAEVISEVFLGRSLDKGQCSQVLQHFSEPETFHNVILRRALVIDVLYSSERAVDTEVVIEALYHVFGTGQILGIASNPPCVEVGLKNLRTKDVTGRCDVEPVLCVECRLLGGRVTAITIRWGESEALWPNPGAV